MVEGAYIDERLHWLDRRYEPCGWHGLATHEHLAKELALALAGTPHPVPHVKGDPAESKRLQEAQDQRNLALWEENGAYEAIAAWKQLREQQ